MVENLDGLASYPATAGSEPLRRAIASWLERRYRLDALDASKQVLPVNGSREALFAFAQTVVDGNRAGARVVMPNPFYQIYEGATLLAGAAPEFINILAEDNFRLDLSQLPESTWADTQLLYVCSPGNPTGNVMTLEDWERVFALSDRHGIVIASDECYSEIYFDESAPPLGALQAAQRLGRAGFPRLVVFGSLSKRSNVPGMRSGYVAGDAAILEKFLLYRTYHGSAMSLAIQAASRAAWEDEAHVRDNRRLYREKFEAFTGILRGVAPVRHAGGRLLHLAAHADARHRVRVPPVRSLQRDGPARKLAGARSARGQPGRGLRADRPGVDPGRMHGGCAAHPRLLVQISS